MKILLYSIGLPILAYCFYILYNDIFGEIYSGKEMGSHFRNLGWFFHFKLLFGFLVGWILIYLAEKSKGKYINRDSGPADDVKIPTDDKKKEKKEEKKKEKKEDEGKGEKKEAKKSDKPKKDEDIVETNKRLEAELKKLQEEKRKLEEKLKGSGKRTEEEEIQKITE